LIKALSEEVIEEVDGGQTAEGVAVDDKIGVKGLRFSLLLVLLVVEDIVFRNE